MEIIQQKDREKVKILAGNALNALLANTKNVPTLFLTSGGSALEILSYVDKKNLNSHLTIGVLDERFSKDPAVNNFLQLKSTNFYQMAKEARASFIETVPGNETLSEFSQRFESLLRKWKKLNPEGKLFITQGIGVDGHTAGIMPYPENPKLFQELFEDKLHWVVGYNAKNKNPYPLRATVNLTFLREVVDVSIVYLVGVEKKPALEKILAKEGTLWQTPGRIVREMKEVKLFTDIF